MTTATWRIRLRANDDTLTIQERSADELRAMGWTRQPHVTDEVIKMVSPSGRIACYIGERFDDYQQIEGKQS